MMPLLVGQCIFKKFNDLRRHEVHRVQNRDTHNWFNGLTQLITYHII